MFTDQLLKIYSPKLAIFIVLFLFSSCMPKGKVERGRQSAYVYDYSAKIKDIDLVPWSIGSGLKKVTITKGFLVAIELPRLSKDDTMFIYETFSVDSWLIRVTKSSGPGTGSVLGYFYAPIVRKEIRSDHVSPATMLKAFFKVMYSAAAPSARFERFECPAFDHNKVIEQYEIFGQQTNPPGVRVSPQETLRANAQKVEITPVQFNGGSSLRGKYEVELALYNSEEKRVSSEWITLNQSIFIISENSKLLPGCSGFQIPERPADTNKVEKFKLKN